MDWDNRTQTGARTSGVEETTPRMAVHHRTHCSDTVRNDDANLHVVQAMPGAGVDRTSYSFKLLNRRFQARFDRSVRHR